MVNYFLAGSCEHFYGRIICVLLGYNKFGVLPPRAIPGTPHQLTSRGLRVRQRREQAPLLDQHETPVCDSAQTSKLLVEGQPPRK